MPTEEGYCPVADGIRLYYQIYADGPTTIVIPNASSWAADLVPFAPGHTRIYYDLRCRGRSDPVTDPAEIGMEQDIRDLDLLRQYFGVEQMALLGMVVCRGHGRAVCRTLSAAGDAPADWRHPC